MTEPLAPPDDTDVLLLLANSATSNENGTLDAQNVGWWVTTTAHHAHTLLFWLTAPAHRVGEKVAFTVNLVDGDGRPVVDDTPRGAEPIRVWGTMTVPVPEGVPAGHPVFCPPVVLHVSIRRTLAPGVYEWRGEVEGIARDHWRRPFVVRS